MSPCCKDPSVARDVEDEEEEIGKGCYMISRNDMHSPVAAERRESCILSICISYVMLRQHRLREANDIQGREPSVDDMAVTLGQRG